MLAVLFNQRFLSAGAAAARAATSVAAGALIFAATAAGNARPPTSSAAGSEVFAGTGVATAARATGLASESELFTATGSGLAMPATGSASGQMTGASQPPSGGGGIAAVRIKFPSGKLQTTAKDQQIQPTFKARGHGKAMEARSSAVGHLQNYFWCYADQATQPATGSALGVIDTEPLDEEDLLALILKNQ